MAPYHHGVIFPSLQMGKCREALRRNLLGTRCLSHAGCYVPLVVDSAFRGPNLYLPHQGIDSHFPLCAAGDNLQRPDAQGFQDHAVLCRKVAGQAKPFVHVLWREECLLSGRHWRGALKHPHPALPACA